jgi:hypothetical protein
MSVQRSQAVAPGRYIPLARITGVEILAARHPVAVVQVGKTTIHGRAPQIFAVGVRMVRAAMRADPRLIAGLADVLPEFSIARTTGLPSSATDLSAEISSLDQSRGDGAGRLYRVPAAVSVAATATGPGEEGSLVRSQNASEEGVREVAAVAASSGAVEGSAARIAD